MAKKGEMSSVPSRFLINGQELRINGDFGDRIHPISGEPDFHNGTDYQLASGTVYLAGISGEVTGAREMGGYGGNVLIYHAESGYSVGLSHMKQFNVVQGDMVTPTTDIGLSGGAKDDAMAGNTTGAHMHLMVMRGRHTSVPAKTSGLFRDPETFDWSIFGGGSYGGGDFKVGDKVKIIRRGNTQANGKGKPSGVIGMERTILKIERNSANPVKLAIQPYRVGITHGKNAGTTGFFKASDLQLVRSVKTNEEIAQEVWQGKWGNGTERVKRLEDAGYDPVVIQKIVDDTSPNKPKPQPEPLKKGDRVEIIKRGNTQSSGKGSLSGQVGMKREILSVRPNSAKPYEVGNKSGTTGFFSSTDLKKI